MYIVRENTEGEYSSIGGRMYAGTDREIVMQESVFSRYGVDRVLKFAFELAKSRPKKHLTSATKSNGIAITMPYWDERVAEMARQYPGLTLDKFHIDILTAHFVQRPDFFDVVGCQQSLRRHPERPWPGLHGDHRHCAKRESESRAEVPVAV
jgi:tartrate dehydrogenase/decarboxylase/D-malate dehydrogenase